jgi:putative transcriptional regulator
VREFDVVGAALLEAIEPAVLAPESLARTLARIDAEAAAAPPPPRAPANRVGADLPAGIAWPRSLRDATITRWRWLGPGMRWSRVTLADDRAANVFLLRIAAGKSLPVHSHDGIELTQVLYGAFDDGRARFGAGDFDEADGSVHHQPVVEAGGECICLASVEGRVAFDGRIARVLGAWVGM